MRVAKTLVFFSFVLDTHAGVERVELKNLCARWSEYLQKYICQIVYVHFGGLGPASAGRFVGHRQTNVLHLCPSAAVRPERSVPTQQAHVYTAHRPVTNSM